MNIFVREVNIRKNWLKHLFRFLFAMHYYSGKYFFFSAREKKIHNLCLISLHTGYGSASTITFFVGSGTRLQSKIKLACTEEWNKYFSVVISIMVQPLVTVKTFSRWSIHREQTALNPLSNNLLLPFWRARESCFVIISYNNWVFWIHQK